MKVVKRTSRLAATAAAFGIGMTSAATFAAPIYEGQVGIRFASPIFGDTGAATKTLTEAPGAFGRVNAGLFHGAVYEPGGYAGFDPTVLYRSLDDILAYCIDLFQPTAGGSEVEYRVYSLEGADRVVEATSGVHPLDRDFDRTLDFLGAINYALQATPGFVGDGDRHYNWLNPTGGSLSGAIQVGIWESLYEDDAILDLTDGAFRATGLDGSGETLLQTAFDAVNGVTGALDYTALDPARALLLISDTRQDVIVGDLSATVPAPAPAALMLAGLVLMARRHAVRAADGRVTAG